MTENVQCFYNILPPLLLLVAVEAPVDGEAFGEDLGEH